MKTAKSIDLKIYIKTLSWTSFFKSSDISLWCEDTRKDNGYKKKIYAHIHYRERGEREIHNGKREEQRYTERQTRIDRHADRQITDRLIVKRVNKQMNIFIRIVPVK